MVSVGTTDQGYTGTTTPAAWRIGVDDGAGGALVVPVVPGEAVTANTVPLGPLLGIAGVLAAALLATVAARLRRRARGRRPPGAPAARTGPGRRRRTLRGRSRSATSRRPTGAGSAPCTTCRSTSSGAWCWACSVPNGAGKTTVLRMLMGLIRPDGRNDPGVRRAGGCRCAGAGPHRGLRRGPGLPAAPVGPGQPAALLGRDRPAHRGGAPRRRPGDRRARRLGAAPGGHLQPGHAPAARDRAGHARAAGAAGARRADERARPAADPRHARGAAALRGGRAHRARVEPPARRGGADLLARRRHAPGHGRRRRHGRRHHRRGRRGELHRRRARRGPPRCSAGSTACARWRVDGDAVHAELNGTPGRRRCARWSTRGVEVRSAGPRRRLEDAFLQLVGEDQAR